jgi:hypothetical protein
MGAKVYAGPACSVVIDKQGMYWLAGKVRSFFGVLVPSRTNTELGAQWKNTGDGSSGQPWSSFRYHPDIMYVASAHNAPSRALMRRTVHLGHAK